MSFRGGEAVTSKREYLYSGDYKNRENTQSHGDPRLPQYLSAPTSLSSHVPLYNATHALSNPAPPTTQWLLQKINSWFGSVESFKKNVILISRVVIVDCISYPFLAYSRQCQLYPYNTISINFIAPFSTIVVLHNIINYQGMSALWRGWKSHVLLLLVRPFLDKSISRLCGVHSYSPKYWLYTLLLKSLPYLVTMPLLSFNYREIAQNTVDKPHENMAEVFNYHPLFRPNEFRCLPLLFLAGPTILHGLLSNATSIFIQRLSERFFPDRTPPDHQNPFSSAVRGLWLNYFSLLLADTLLYPMETVLFRMYCQGMPALVDNIQTGTDMVFISSYYSGFIGCVCGVWDSEGVLGFFRGFSSLLIRYTIHGMLLLMVWRTVHTLNNRFKLNNR